MLIRGFKKWPRNQQIALPILSVFAFGALFNQMQARNSEPVSIHVENPRIIDGDTLETLDKKRVRLSGIDAPDEDGKGNVPKIAAQLYLEELVKQNGGMDCTSDFQDEKLTVEGFGVSITRRCGIWRSRGANCRTSASDRSREPALLHHTAAPRGSTEPAKPSPPIRVTVRAGREDQHE